MIKRCAVHGDVEHWQGGDGKFRCSRCQKGEGPSHADAERVRERGKARLKSWVDWADRINEY